MTAQIVVMNRHGVAFAVDSAVTYENGKAYNSADKLFPVGANGRVAFADFGVASFLRAPWDIVIKTYIAELGGRSFATLEAYRASFLQFLDSEHPLFDASFEAYAYLDAVRDYWRDMIGPVYREFGEVEGWGDDAWNAMRAELAEDANHWRYATMPGFADDFGKDALEEHSKEIGETFELLFDGRTPPIDIRISLLVLAERMFTQEWISPRHRSGIVIVGFGEEEYYPSCIHIDVGPRVLGRTRWIERAHQAIGDDLEGTLLPFAQSDSVRSFIQGMPERALQQLSGIVSAEVGRVIASVQSWRKGAPAVEGSEVVNAVMTELNNLLHKQYTAPIVDAISALPGTEMANLARTLVSLEAFRSKISVSETGSVGGEIRVGLITKHEGFTWVQSAG